MVNEKVNIRDKKRGLKRFLKISIFVFLFLLVGLMVYYAYLGFFSKGERVVLENPLKGIVFKYSVEGRVSAEDVGAVVEEAVLKFDKDYINYILVALGINNLHKSVTFENPKIEIDVGEVWSSEIVKGVPNTVNSPIDEEDIKITLSKEEAVMALLSQDIEQFMKESVSSGRTNIEMVVGKVELFNKGYLGLYKDLTGDELEVE